MKKIFSLFIVIGILLGLPGCDIIDLFTKLSPPEWILGTWSDDIDIVSWTFTSDNAMYSVGYLTTDFKEMNKAKGVSVTDTSTSTKYALVLSANGISTTYIFEKVSDTTMNFDLTGMIILLSKK